MQAMNKSQAYIVLEEVTQYLADYSFFMDAGSLIGIHRNGDFIDHDTDIDFAIVMDPNGQMDFPTPDWPLVAVWNYRNLPMQRAYEYKGVIIDFYFYYLNLEEELIVNHNDHGVLKLKVEDVLPTSIVEFMGYPIRMPNNPEKVILSEYGKDWETPRTSKGDWGQERFNLFYEFPHWPLSLEGHIPNENLTKSVTLQKAQIEELASDNLMLNENLNNRMASHRAQLEELTSDNQMLKDTLHIQMASHEAQINELLSNTQVLDLQLEAVVNSRIWRFTKFYRKMRSNRLGQESNYGYGKQIGLPDNSDFGHKP